MKKITFLFNFSFGPKIGYGHLSRCLAVAEVLQAENHLITFPRLLLEDPMAMSILSTSKLLPTFETLQHYDVQIVDSYKNITIPNIASTCIQFIDSVSIDYNVDAYICVSPVTNWQLAKDKPIKLFQIDPPLREYVFESSKKINESKTKNVAFLFGGGSYSEIKNSVIKILDDVYLPFSVHIFSVKDENLVSPKNAKLKIVKSGGQLLNQITSYKYIISSCGVLAWELIALKKNVYFYRLTENQNVQFQLINKMGYNTELNFNLRYKRFTNLVDILTNLKSFEPKSSAVLDSNGAINISNFILNLIN